MNISRRIRFVFFCLLSMSLAFAAPAGSWAQQTLGTINGTVTDASGAAVGDATVTVSGDTTGLTRSAKTQRTGYFEVLNLPVGSYTVSITHDGFDTTRLPAIAVQEARATTVNTALKVGQASESVTVNANPLLNATDTTNGYTLDKAQIEATPLATGSFTQLAILAPGVSAELLAGTGSNEGLGNQPIWANGQRDTSNSFQVNGVDVTNLFNGKSSSAATSQRLNFNIGEIYQPGGGTQTNTSVYGSNGNGLASPPPEFIQELRVNTSMYDAQQGQTSGAHVDVNTSSGGNAFHGRVWGNRGTDWLNAAPFFYKQDGVVPAVPELHRFMAGATVGGPIIKDKLFFFLGYQRQQANDQYGGLSRSQVPFGLTDDRSTAGIDAALASYYAATGATPAVITSFDPAAVALLNAKLPSGQFLIPSSNTSSNIFAANQSAYNALEVGTSRFQGDQADATLDYTVSSGDQLSLKYYYQHTPTVSPYSISQAPGFAQNEDTGAQVASINNSISIGSKINWEQRLGFSRQKVYSDFDQGLDPGSVGITIPGYTKFPGISVSDFAFSGSNSFSVGPNSDFVDAGYFQNRLSPSTNAIFSLGAHTVSVGMNYSYNQLNIRNDRVGSAQLSIKNFPSFLEGKVNNGSILLGNTQRYYRSNDFGGYAQDKWQARPNLSITAGLRYDYDGPFSEKYGNLFNFDPARYSASDTAVTNSGFIVAGNNKQYATPGVSDSTLQGRQWGLGPRVGIAYAPSWNHGSVVWRAGYGIYYDRGEYFQYLSPPAGQGISGPFGVTQEAPLASYANVSGKLDAPFGTAPLGNGQSNPSIFDSLLPTVSQIKSECTAANVYNATSATAYACAARPYIIGDYDIHNKLPYTQNWTLDFQWQPRSDLALDIGYVGNRGRHAVIPLPFNEPGIASPSHPINGETYSYAYQVLSNNYDEDGNPIPMSTEPYDSYSGGNVDLRVPYVGYDPNSTDFRAAGVSSYDALQVHLEKRLTHGIQVGASYTFSHTLDEQSDIGLFFTGDNPSDLRSSYASSDYDRTHIVVFNYLFALPDFVKQHNLVSYLTNGWALVGVTVLQSGQPYSIYDYSGSVGSLYFGTNENIINPILPLAPGVRPRQALTGHSGAFLDASGNPIPSLDPSKFQIPLVNPGVSGVPPCDPSNGPGGGPLCDVYETAFVPGQRNIFRQAFQKRADITLQKTTQLTERIGLRYRFEVFNVTNTPSFDVPTNNIQLSPNYGELGGNYVGTQVQPYYSTSVATPQSPGGQGTCQGAAQACAYLLYTIPQLASSKIGVVTNTIGSPRIIQMSMHLTF